MAAAISLLATLITLLFAGVILLQCRRRPSVYRLVWAAALVFYGLATAMQFVAEISGWNVAAFRVWYLFGGLLTAAYLGQGTALLVLPRRPARALLWILVLASAYGALRLATLHLSIVEIAPPAGKVTPRADALSGDLRALAALLNIYGTLLLVGGALWSAVLYFDRMLDSRRRAGYRLVANLLIAGGALIVAGAGSLETFGHGEYLYAGEIIGITLVFVGFLCSSEPRRLPFSRPRTTPSGSGSKGPDPAQPHAPPTPARSLRRVSDRVPPVRR
jgi:hypothetical protein